MGVLLKCSRPMYSARDILDWQVALLQHSRPRNGAWEVAIHCTVHGATYIIAVYKVASLHQLSLRLDLVPQLQPISPCHIPVHLSRTLRQLSWTIEGPLLSSQTLLTSGSLHHSHRVPSHHLPSSLDALKDQVSDLPFWKCSKRLSTQL